VPLTSSEAVGLSGLAGLVDGDGPARDLRRAGWSFCSRSQLLAMRVDSSARAAVLKRPTEVRTPLPESISE
jgi:hypothetical protein